MLFSNKKSAGFTLIEILISIAITAILTTITFLGFSQEQRRSNSRRAAEQLQTNLQVAQNRAQSAITLGTTKLCSGSAKDGVPCSADTDCDDLGGSVSCASKTGRSDFTCGTCVSRPPESYGVLVDIGTNKYTECIDVNYDGAAASDPDQYCLNAAEIGQSKLLATGLSISAKYDGVACTVNCNGHIFFDVPSGDTTIRRVGVGTGYSSLEIIFKDSQLNVCYSVTIQKTSGTVSRRQLATCP